MEPKPGKTPEQTTNPNYSSLMDALDRNVSPKSMHRMGINDGVVDERVFMVRGDSPQLYFITKDGPFKTASLITDKIPSDDEERSRQVLYYVVSTNYMGTIKRLSGRYTKLEGHNTVKLEHSNAVGVKIKYEFVVGEPDGMEPITQDDFANALFSGLAE